MNMECAAPTTENRPEHGVPFLLRIGGMAVVGLTLVLIAQPSRAASVAENVPTSQKACLRSMHALIDQSKGSATRVELSSQSPTLSSAVIYVADGEVQIVCNSVAKEMTIKRVLDVADDAPIEPSASKAQASL